MASTAPTVQPGHKVSKRCSQKTFTPIMGKSRKLSKGHSNGFVPDYRHAVGTTAQSDGLGSSDTEMTLSEESCRSKRKRASLNSDGCDHLGVPFQVLSLPSMSKPERKDLELRLKRELEQVRSLQRRVASLSSNAADLSPATDICSRIDGQKREDVRMPQPPMGKKRAILAQSGPQAKKTLSGRAPSFKQAVPVSTSNAALMKQCEGLLDQLMGHQFAYAFLVPVDVVKFNIPDYYTVIKHPMDLGTVKKKLLAGEYPSPLDFAADVRLTFSNAMTYNPPKNHFHEMAKTLRKYFDSRFKAIEKKIPAVADAQPAPSTREDSVRNDVSDWIPPPKKNKVQSTGFNGKLQPVKRAMTAEEKDKLSVEVQNVLEEMPDDIINFLKDSNPNADQVSEDEIEIDIHEFSDDALFKLKKLLDDYLLEKKNNQTKAELCEMEVQNESGFSNLLMQPCEGNDIVDEDIDIGGDDPPLLRLPSEKLEEDNHKQSQKCRSPSNSSSKSGSKSSGNDEEIDIGGNDEDIDIGGNDPPISSCPPVEIERYIANKSSKCSSSSSGSDSSSSDSDTGSSSESEPENDKVTHPVISLKEKVDPHAGSCEIQRTLIDQDGANDQSHDNLNHAGPNARNKPPSAEVDGLKEEEKSYRVALLKSRFADTILKAEEKKLEKGGKRDPEKLRLEREELERRKKEEKARLQAEAKAAEEARRKAEAAEAKRKREMEREAARIALQKMEKTVDINDNCQFMEGLEMLGSAPTDNRPGFIGDSSLNNSNGLDSFKFQGFNPLEQLGLSLKVDDDEEEEEAAALQSTPDPMNNAEEGEID